MNMTITDEMLKIAILKSVEAGLLPRRALKEDFPDAQEMMHAILYSALQRSPANNMDAEISPIKAKTATQDTLTPSSQKGKFLPANLHNFY
jgi:hypothetical protein